MSSPKKPYVCPASFAGGLDNFLRRWLHKPERILKPYISKGMTILDLGCGPGYFTTELARLTGEGGKVIAADLQPEMLELMMAKIRGTELEKRVVAHVCHADRIGISVQVDFILAFWMVHEVPDHSRLFDELKSILKPGGRILIVEPKFHVTGNLFRKMVEKIVQAGLEVIDRPDISISRSVYLANSSDRIRSEDSFII